MLKRNVFEYPKSIKTTNLTELDKSLAASKLSQEMVVGEESFDQEDSATTKSNQESGAKDSFDTHIQAMVADNFIFDLEKNHPLATKHQVVYQSKRQKKENIKFTMDFSSNHLSNIQHISDDSMCDVFNDEPLNVQRCKRRKNYIGHLIDTLEKNFFTIFPKTDGTFDDSNKITLTVYDDFTVKLQPKKIIGKRLVQAIRRYTRTIRKSGSDHIYTINSHKPVIRSRNAIIPVAIPAVVN
jgi:hypothetical protein